MKEITVELDSPFMYNPGTGGEIEASHLTIKSPNGKVAHLAAILKAEIGMATKKSLEGLDLSGMGDGSSGDESDDEKGEAAYALMLMGGADMKKVIVTFKEIMRESALIAGEKTFTSATFDKLEYSDIEKSLKKYLGVFT